MVVQARVLVCPILVAPPMAIPGIRIGAVAVRVTAPNMAPVMTNCAEVWFSRIGIVVACEIRWR